MARIETDPNYTTPTFSRATAAADIFKKEDVQALAAAMSTHVHDGGGKGLGVVPPAGSIPGSALADGSITSAKIADGTIQTIDIALNAITAANGNQAFGAFAGNTGSTTSTTFVDVAAPSSITITLRAGYIVLLVVSGAVGLSSAGGIATLGLKVDGAAPLLVKRIAPLVANTATPFVMYGMYGGNTGSHTFQLAWNVSTGTLSMDAASSMVMYALEFLR